MLKIKVLSDYPYSIAFGGKEIQLQQYIDYLSPDCDISLLNYHDKKEFEGVHILHLFGHTPSFLNIVKHVKVKYPTIKVVVSPTFYTERNISYKIASKLGRKLPFSNIFRDLSLLAKMVDLVIVNSEPEKIQFHDYFKCNNDKIEVIFNGVESQFSKEKFVPLDKEPPFELNNDYILSVGFFDERKNTNKLIASFLDSQTSRRCKLVLVGTPRFSTEQHRVEFECLTSDNPDRVVVVGFLERDSKLLYELYKNCKFHVLVSKLETPGLSNIESLMHGKNILVGLCDPVKSYFNDVAFYCDPNSQKSITKTIDSMASMKLHPSEFLKKIAIDNFSLESISKKVFSHYTRLSILND